MAFHNSSPLRVTIAVLLAACSSNTEPWHPKTRLGGAAVGAVQGMGYTLGSMKDFQCDPSGAALCMTLMGFALLIIVPTGAVIGAVVGAASVDTDGKSAEEPEQTSTVADGSYNTANKDWSIRLAISGSHFQGTAFCKRAGIPIDFSGSIASDRAIKGIGKIRAYRFYNPYSLAPFPISGRWPVIEIDASACKPA
jgi:hypothetical protein